MPPALAWFPFGGFLGSSRSLPARFVDVFPDAAWAYALTAMLALLWSPPRRGRDSDARGARAWIACGPLAAAGWELGQWAGIIPGTFDLADLVFGVVASLAAVFTCFVAPPLLSLDLPKES
jgi:hypothetical protein